MNTTSTRSQTPWKHRRSTNSNEVVLEDHNQEPLADGLDEANAAHICLCVNAHEELRDAIEVALEDYDLCGEVSMASIDHFRTVLKKLSV